MSSLNSTTRAQVCLLLACFWLISCHDDSLLEVTLTSPRQGELMGGFSASGRVAGQQVELRTACDGRVLEVPAQRGHLVEKGALLVQLDRRESQARVKAARAELAATESRLKEARLALQAGGAGRAIVQERVNALQHDLARLQAQLAIANIQLEEHTLRAPIRAMVAHLAAEPGLFVQRGEHLATLVNTEELSVEALVDEQEATYVIYGQDVFLRLPSRPGEVYQGEVREVARMLEAGDRRSGMVRRLPIRVLFRNPPENLKVGLEVDVEAEFKLLKDALTLPRGALYSAEGRDYVWAVVQGRLQKTEVEVGLVTQERFEVKSGVTAASRVVVDRPEGLREGRRVNER